MRAKKIIGIGNALMDVVVKLNDDSIFEKNGLIKGYMTLVDAEKSVSINQQTEGKEKILTPGGSVANTVAGLAHLGSEVAFVGKVGNDELGRNYQEGLKSIGARSILFKSEISTGVAMALVSPDSERTFGTYLGAAIGLSPDDITPDLFTNYNIAYIEGYLVQNHDLVRKAALLAKEAGLTIALDLASANVVTENLGFLKEILTNYVDIVFANEEEAKAFTSKAPREAAIELASICNIAIVKTGAQGSIISTGQTIIEIGITGTSCIDTTGAGDLYAAGFLHGYSKELPLETCGKIASIVAGKVITVYGARMDQTHWDSILKEITAIQS